MYFEIEHKDNQNKLRAEGSMTSSLMFINDDGSMERKSITKDTKEFLIKTFGLTSQFLTGKLYYSHHIYYLSILNKNDYLEKHTLQQPYFVYLQDLLQNEEFRNQETKEHNNIKEQEIVL